MNKIIAFLFLLLLAVSYNRRVFSNFALYPAIPPIAFIDQYYTCDFRVTGLSHPVYTFEGLPKFLKGSETGRLEGKPDKAGTYEITVIYKEVGYGGRKNVIFRVN